uniref:DNA-directed primase/polymerase protein n=1 Tax=Macrostomum lignano TaxID=282301 RepID=A0A1I8HMS8_9PLAT
MQSSKQLTRKRKSTDELELVARRLLGNKIVSPPAQRRLLSDWQFSDYFRSQSDALEYYKRCCHGDSCLEPSKLPPLVMSSESASLGYQGQRLYFVCDLQTGIDYLLGHPVGRRHLYELIPEGSRCRLYFDLEFDRLSNPDLDGSMATDILLGFIRNLLTVAFGDTGATHSDWMEAVQLDASTDQKFSRHVIFPNVVFSNNEIMGRFIRFAYALLMEWLALDSFADELDHGLPVYRLANNLCLNCQEFRMRILKSLEQSSAGEVYHSTGSESLHLTGSEARNLTGSEARNLTGSEARNLTGSE